MKILIADDHALLSDSLALLLRGRYGDSLHILHAEEGRIAVELAHRHADLDLVLLDINLPDMHGHQVLEELLRRLPNTPVIAISGNSSAQLIQQSLALGAAGFIPKTSSGKVMLSAIEYVLDGGTFIPPEALQTKTATPAGIAALTDRQIEVLRLIRKGLSNDEIAANLSISLATVKSHVHSVFASLQVKNRTEAVNEALLLNLL